MDDFARATDAGRVFTIDGRDYRVGKLTPRGLGDLQTFLKDAIEDPRVRTRRLMEGLPEGVQLRMWEMACAEARDWPPSLGSPEAMALLMSAEGQARLLWVAFRKHNNVSLDQARELSAEYELSQDELARLMELLGPDEVGDPFPPTTGSASPTRSSATTSA